MKPEYKPLKELTNKVKKFKTKVKVLHKGYPQQSPNKPRYQRLVLEDEEGFSMKATLFNNNIERYAEALQRKGEYELDDATIKAVPEPYAARPNEFSMVINDYAKINPFSTDPNVFAPEYQPISSISREPFDKKLYDVLGVLLYISDVKEVEHSTERKDGRKDKVRELHIIDHRPLKISLWNEIITVHEKVLQSWADSFTVKGFLAITTRSYKGFSMSSSMSTAIVAEPDGPRAEALREWAARNKDMLIDHRSKLVEIYSPTEKEIITTLETINQKKAHNTWQEEVFTVRATIPNVTPDQMHLYVGCNKCSRGCDENPGTKFTCQHCFATEAIADSRVVLKVNVVDVTGSLELPMFAKDVEQLLGLSALELWTLSNNGSADIIAAKIYALRESSLLIKIGPTLALSTSRVLSRVLSWAVKSITIEGEGGAKDSDTAASTSGTTDEAGVLQAESQAAGMMNRPATKAAEPKSPETDLDN